MVPVVVAALLGSLWLVVRARRLDTARDDRRRGAWPLALTCLALATWFAVDQLAVGSGHLADTAERVYHASDPGQVPGPVGLLSATELALDTELRLTEVGRDVLPTRSTTSYELTDRLFGLPVGTACVQELRLTDATVPAEVARSYEITSGGC